MKRPTRILAAIGILLTVGITASWGAWRLSKSRAHQLFGTLVTRVETPDSLVALTFDDGPTIPYTDSVLHILAEYQVPATFFVIGTALTDHPDVAARIVAAGHELGNHSHSHRRMVLKTPRFVRREIEQTDRLIQAAGQSGAPPFRPPYGKRLVVLPWYLARADRPTILWDLEPDSYPGIAREPERIVQYVLNRARPGSIVLLHVEVRARATSRAALPEIIEGLRHRGYQFVTVSELLRRTSTL